MTFGEIYTTSLACSSKGTKSMKDKIYADPIFSRAIAMVSPEEEGELREGRGVRAHPRPSLPLVCFPSDVASSQRWSG